MALLKNTTRLEAVNTLLASIGESPINSLDAGLVESETAERQLDETNRSVQSMGWVFNTERGLTLQVNERGQIPVPEGILRIEVEGKDIIRRGKNLYNRSTHTDQFTTPQLVSVVWGFDFEDLPEAARQYIMLRAAQQFQSRFIGDGSMDAFLGRDAEQAWVILKDYDGEAADASIFDNEEIQIMLNRESNVLFSDIYPGSIPTTGYRG